MITLHFRPPVIEDYNGETKNDPKNLFLYRQQDLLLQLAETFKVPHTRTPSDSQLQHLLEAFVAYRKLILDTPDAQIPAIFSDDILRHKSREVLALKLPLQKKLSPELRNKDDEWKDIVQMTAFALDHLFDPYVRFAAILNLDNFDILSELLHAMQPNEPLHHLRCVLLHEFVKAQDDGDTSLKLLQHIIESDNTHPLHTKKNGSWITLLREYEEDILLTACLKPTFKKSTRCELVRLCLEADGEDTKSRELAATIIVRAFTGKKSVEAFLSELHFMFTNNPQSRFDKQKPERIEAIFLWLLLGSTLKEDQNRAISCHLVLLYALPYCIDYLQGLASDSLTKSVDGSDIEIKRALCETINELSLTGSIAPTSADWEQINKLICRVIAPRTTAPLETLVPSLCYWYARTNPSGRRIARVLSIFEQFVHGVGKQEEHVAHLLFRELVSYDNKLLAVRPGNRSEPDGFFVTAFAQIVDQDMTNPSWIQTLSEVEQKTFFALSQNNRSRRYLNVELFPKCFQDYEKDLPWALSLCPSLDVMNLLKVAQGCTVTNKPALFIEAMKSRAISEKTRDAIFQHLYYGEPENSLQFYEIVPSHSVLLVLTRLQSAFANYPDAFKYLCFKATIAVSPNDKEKVYSLFMAIRSKYGLQSEISEDLIKEKLK